MLLMWCVCMCMCVLSVSILTTKSSGGNLVVHTCSGRHSQCYVKYRHTGSDKYALLSLPGDFYFCVFALTCVNVYTVESSLTTSL